MEVKIFWTDFAKLKLREIYEYYLEYAGVKIARNETAKIAKATLILQEQPKIGRIEELLNGEESEYRYLVHQSYKIIYRVQKGRSIVEIMDVFHTRQYPQKIRRSR
ncbi:MAG TPA: type II toxin-antitoxin system RelE/ParE family toxin [Cryomorphaceae bacterium]|nr:type II toxin-antitoxin system RelE/ParE family toxin [Cryomorphaceae bacterium]HKL39739.1 type II toxin-antitoxin system RelE/ParE family toxin [Cryomorphaceae bacterium]